MILAFFLGDRLGELVKLEIFPRKERLAKLEGAAALFARRKRELEKEIEKWLDVQVHFLEDPLD